MQRILPESAQKIRDWLESSTAGKTLVDSLKNTAGDSKTIQNVGSAAGSLVTAVAAVVLVFFLSIYFSLDPLEYLEGALRVFPPSSRPRVRLALENAGEALRKWLIAQLVAMVIVGVLVGVSLALLGVPLALLLGTLAALLEFIPVVGPVLFTIPGLLVAFTKGPAVALYALLAYLVVQQLESNVIIPLLQRWALRLPPVISLLSVLAGGLLFGPMGVVIATPMAVVVIELVKRLYVEETIEHPPRKDDALPSAGETVTRRA
jgi:predicted PurR-regulated permease PerM